MSEFFIENGSFAEIVFSPFAIPPDMEVLPIWEDENWSREGGCSILSVSGIKKSLFYLPQHEESGLRMVDHFFWGQRRT